LKDQKRNSAGNVSKNRLDKRLSLMAKLSSRLKKKNNLIRSKPLNFIFPGFYRIVMFFNMISKARPAYLNISIALLLCVLIKFNDFLIKKGQQENHPPVVKIISPKNNGPFEFNGLINYEISVTDKEDGDSKYDEINAKEVLLEVRYFADKSRIAPILNKGIQPDAQGMGIMRTSNCFNCHNFNGKSIGPSFYEISKRYPATKANTDTLIKHIREGSTNTWGKEKMPTHAELTNDEIRSTVQWILKHAADPGVDYYIGTEGAFRIKPPTGTVSKSGYLLTASYVDNGLKNAPGKQRLKGEDRVVIFGK